MVVEEEEEGGLTSAESEDQPIPCVIISDPGEVSNAMLLRELPRMKMPRSHQTVPPPVETAGPGRRDGDGHAALPNRKGLP